MLELLLVRLLAVLLGRLPFGAVYALSDGLCWVLFSVVGYRRRVVFENLRRSFPEKSEAEISQITRLFYQNLCDITLEGFKGLTMPPAEMRRRYRFLNAEAVNFHLEKNRPVILTGMHYANWEWGVRSFSLWFSGQVVGVFKPMSNRRVEAFVNKKRGELGMELCHPKDTRAAVEKYKNHAAVFVLMADQSPSTAATVQWLTFLGQPTACIHGPETIARAHGMPVFQFEAARVRRGFYEIKLKPVCLEPGAAREGDITAAFFSSIEKRILERPADWLWSHRRWKLAPPVQTT